MSTAGDPATAEQRGALARSLGVSDLPIAYADFLSQCNGGRPHRNLVAIRTTYGLESAVLDDFLALEGKYSVFATSTRLWQAFRLPRSAAVIGDDHNGNHLVISLEAESFGAVYFWDHERGTTDHDVDDSIADFAQMTLLAATFDVFVAEHLLDQAALDAIYEVEPPRQVAPVPSPQPIVDRFAHRVSHVPSPDAADGTEVCRLASDSGAKQARINNKILAATWPNNGVAVGQSWPRPTATVIVHDPPLDLPFKASNLLLLNQLAQTWLKPTLAPFGEFLELDSETGPLCIFRCLNIVDALVPGTAIDTDPKSLDGWVFDPDKTASAGIFTVPQQRDRPWIFYPPSFLRLLAESGLGHTYFELVWDVAHGSRTLVY